MTSAEEVRRAVADAHRREWGFVLAATARVAGSIDVAEECVQDAYGAALDAWLRDGIPSSPGAWLTTTARRRALDVLRRDQTLRRKLPLLVEPVDTFEMGPAPGEDEPEAIPDDRLRLVFTCCHPALSREAQVALTLRLVCGLSTDEIARAFLVPEADHGRPGDPGEEEDRRSPHPLPGAGGSRPPRAAGRRPDRRAPASSRPATSPRPATTSCVRTSSSAPSTSPGCSGP